MSQTPDSTPASSLASPLGSPGVVVVTGANGLVGSRCCAALLERGAVVRGIVRRAGTAPAGVEERVGELHDPAFTAEVLRGAEAVVSTVHPLGGDLATQHRVAVEVTPALARAAREAGVPRFVHVSTAAVYDRSPQAGDVDEASPLVGDDAGDYPVTKRDADLALADVDGLTRVLLRPPAILGAGATSIWNTLRPAALRDDSSARRGDPGKGFAWVHVDDLARLAADVAVATVVTSLDPARGPLEGGCTAVNVAAGPATWRDYLGAVTEALGVAPQWVEEDAWRGQVLAGRARGWGWAPQVDLAAALAEVRAGLQ